MGWVRSSKREDGEGDADDMVCIELLKVICWAEAGKDL